MDPTIQARFWTKVDVRNHNDCWLWTAATTHGYGVIWFEKRVRHAHRVSWELTYGKPPDDLCVLHKCDVHACVNPSHLFLGTHRDNMQDMVSKGRGMHITKPETLARGDRHGSRTKPGSLPHGGEHWSRKFPLKTMRGERNGEAKLSSTKVRAIRKDTRLHREIAESYGVSRPTITAIRARRAWKHIS